MLVPRLTTPPTHRVLPRLQQKRWVHSQFRRCNPILQTGEVKVKWNICKAVGLDGIPGHVLRACTFQLARVYADILNLSLSPWFPHALKKSTIVPIPKKIFNHMLEWLEARCSDPHLQQVFWETHQRLHPLQFAYCSNRSTVDAIAFTLHTALSHLENKNTYVRMLFVDYSSAFNTIVPACHTGCEAPDSGTEQISVQLDPGLPDRQKSGGQNGQQHLISPGHQLWCSAGLHPQPTPVLPVHTWLYSNTQLQRHRQICWRHNGDRPDHWQWWDGLQRGGEYPD